MTRAVHIDATDIVIDSEESDTILEAAEKAGTRSPTPVVKAFARPAWEL